MLDYQTIRELSDKAAREAARKNLTPYVPFNAAEIDDYPPFPFPNLGSHRPAGWQLVDEWFCDSSGLGADDEGALSTRQLIARLRENVPNGYGYGVIEAGEFQVVLGVFSPDGSPDGGQTGGQAAETPEDPLTANLLYYVIYDCDWADGVAYVKAFAPPHTRRDWQITEDDDQAEIDGLERHRKWVTREPITQAAFDEFVQHCDLAAEEVETLGSLTELGWLPAISFRAESKAYEYDAWISAYVTPLPNDADGNPIPDLDEDDWEDVRTWILEKYGE
jgi:hypothetical protein